MEKKPLPTHQTGKEYTSHESWDAVKPKRPDSLKQKQKKGIESYANQPDPVGDFVRRVIGGNKSKKQGL